MSQLHFSGTDAVLPLIASKEKIVPEPLWYY